MGPEEQRMAVLALKMGEIYFMEERVIKVLLLLDDIFPNSMRFTKRSATGMVGRW
jgi:hypothetical protein